MNIASTKKQYQELKTELKICNIGGLFLALYNNKEVPKLLIQKLKREDDLQDFFQFPLYMDEQKVPFPILFEQAFEQIGNQSNIYHVLGIEKTLSSKAAKEFLGYLQYARERFKSKPYSLVFWITPEFEEKLFFQAPDFHHWVFGTYDFTNIEEEELKILTSSVNKELLDIQKIEQYLEKVIWQYQNWETVKKNNESFLLESMKISDLYNYYIQLYYADEQNKEKPLDDLVDNFLEDKKQNLLTILGDYGTGKSSFIIHYFIKIAQKYINDKTERIPILISIKNYRGKLNIENLIVKEFYDKYKIEMNLSIFQQLALEGKFTFFIDGFDEMVSSTNQEVTLQNLKELTKLSFENILFMAKAQNKTYKANKILLTSRTHYFLTELEERDILKADYTILYRNYATKSNYEINRVKLRKFNKKQIIEYIQKHTNNKKETSKYIKIIEDTYNLKELSTRPLLLDLIVKTMPKLTNKKNINPASLYRAYINTWIERESWRSQMTSEGKKNFMCEIAVKMFDQPPNPSMWNLHGEYSLHHSQLDKPNDEYFKPNYNISDRDYFKYESTNCSFLNRDSDGNYKFIHKSFMEYFVAESFYSNLRQNNTQIIQYSFLTNEIKDFLKNIIELQKHELDGLNCSNFDLSQTDLESASLKKTNLSGANLNDAQLSNAQLNEAQLYNASLVGAKLPYANLSHANLRKANLTNANLSHSNLMYANLRDVMLSHAILNDADLIGADLSVANLSYSQLNDADLRNANLIYADLEKAELRHAILIGSRLIRTKLIDANLSHACLIDANLSEAKLIGATLTQANMSDANFSGAKLIGAELSGAKVSDSDFKVADLTHANLTGTKLRRTSLIGASLFKANLADASLRNANLNDSILIKVVNITPSQIKLSINWDQAVYRGYWDENKSKWVINEQANQKSIDQIKQSLK